MPICSSSRLAVVLRRTLLSVLLGAGLWLLFLQADRLWLPEAWQSSGHLLYRLCFWLTLPVLLVVRALSPPIDHHWLAIHYLVVAFGTGLWVGGLWSWRLWRRQRRETEGPGGARDQPEDNRQPITRRRFVGRVAAGTAGAAFAGVGVYGAGIAPLRLRVRSYTVKIAGLPPALEGLTLVQLTDTHHGRFVPLSLVRAAVQQANQLKPDLVLLTGDYVHGTRRAIAPGIAVFEQLRPRIGTLAVLGNHDHWEGARACRAAFARTGIALIDNRRRFVGDDRSLTTAPPTRGGLCIAGLGDLWEDEVALERAVRRVSPSTPRLVLAHNPDTAERLDPAIRVDLMLSGHTHGGQVRIPGLGTPLVPSGYGQKYVGGLCQGPTCPVLVSRGVGLSVLPVRLGVLPEISRIVLQG